MSLHHSIVNITEFHLDSDDDLRITEPLVKIYYLDIINLNYLKQELIAAIASSTI